METWHWPQYVEIAMFFLAMLIAAYNSGKEKEEINNFFFTLLASIIHATVLYYGGFWK